MSELQIFDSIWPNREHSILFRGLIYTTFGISSEVVFTAVKRLISELITIKNDKHHVSPEHLETEQARRTEAFRLVGHTQLYVAPLYFLGGTMLFERIHNCLRDKSILRRLSTYVTLILMIEYFAGRLYKRMLGKCPWHYKESNWTLHGCINLKYIPLWALVGFLGEKTHNTLIYGK